MLYRKLFRDIRKNITQFVTIFLMVAIGVFAYSGIESYMDGMRDAADVFYSQCNLQDMDVYGTGFSEDDLEEILQTDHVQKAERKITIMTTVSSSEHTIELNFIESNEISSMYVAEGEAFDPDQSGIWLDLYYAEENDISVGDVITVKYDGMVLEEEVVGLIQVPDHVYSVKDSSVIFPDHTEYGYAYISINEFPESYIKDMVMESAGIEDESVFDLVFPDFDYREYLPFTSVMVDVDDKEYVEDVKQEIYNNVDAATAITNIENSTSYLFYQGEIEEGETYVGVFSGLFIFIALLSVITTMTRFVNKERMYIGTLKALGFTDFKIAVHYVGYGFFCALAGAVVGLITGPVVIGNFFVNMEMEYFSVPNASGAFRTSYILVAILIVFLISLVTYLTCRKELRENPADSLRVRMPKAKGVSLNITSRGIFAKMSFSSKWNLRDIFRNKLRTLTGIVGIAGCCAIMVCAFGMYDSLNYFMDWQFDDLYQFAYKLTLKEDVTDAQYDDILAEYGDDTSLTLGIEIDAGDALEANNILVYDAGDMLQFTDPDGGYVVLPDNGISVTRKMAENYDLETGDTVRWHIYGDNTYYETEIVCIDADPQNQNIKMTKAYYEELTGNTYKADSVYTNQDLSDVKEIAGIELIQNKDLLKGSMNTMMNTMKMMIVLLVGVAAVLGTVIIYNLGVLSYTEKQYQFATLKVLGFSEHQIRNIYVRQNNWITIVSVIIGLPLGYLLTEYLFVYAVSDTYDMHANIQMISYVYSAVGTMIVSLAASHILAGRIKYINMVESLKGNE